MGNEKISEIVFSYICVLTRYFNVFCQKVNNGKSQKMFSFLPHPQKKPNQITFPQTLGCDIFSSAPHARPHLKNCSAHTCARTSIFW